MRSVTVNIYKYNELPTEEAKETARNWWKELEATSWSHEHSQSVKAAMKFIDNCFPDGEAIKAAAMKLQGDCPCCADATAIDAIVEACGGLSHVSDIKYRVQCDMERAWEKEMESAMEDENVEEMLIINEYEFTENGKPYRH